MSAHNAEIDEIDEATDLGLQKTDDEAPRKTSNKKAKSIEVDFRTMTSREMLEAGGLDLSGYRSKRELGELLEERGVTVLNMPKHGRG